MKKIRWATHKNLFSQIASSSCLVAVSAGVVFGVSAGTFKVEYLDLDNAEARLKAAVEHNYSSQNIISQWNMFQKGKPGDKDYIKGVPQPTSRLVEDDWWKEVHPGTTRLDKKFNDIDPKDFEIEKDPEEDISKTAEEARKKYASLVIDGSTHTALDRSFNQGLYNGIANFNTNKKHDVTDNSEGLVFKPSQDSTQEFVNIYRAVAAKSRILCLAGFNHVTPLNALGKRTADGIYEFSDNKIANAGMMLMDGDITNNQNVASVLFRSDQPAFLTAVATCMYFYNNLHMYHSNFKDMTVAAYGGTAIPTVIIYMGGFQRGIEFFNRFVLKNSLLKTGFAQEYAQNKENLSDVAKYFIEKLLPASKYKDEIVKVHDDFVKSGKTAEWEQRVSDLSDKLYQEYSIKMIKLGDFGTHFSGSFASGDAIGISKQYLNRGASAIIAVAGPQSLDTAQEIMNQNSNCIVIGVDSAMERSDYQKPFKSSSYKDMSVAPDKTTPAQASNIIKFSAVKDMTNVSDKMLRLAASGQHWDVNNTKPWLSAAQLPTYAESEVVSDTLIKFEDHPDNGTFDVIGLDETTRVQSHVLRLPLHREVKVGETTKTLSLDKIYGFDVIAGGSGTTAGQLARIDTLCFSGSLDEHQTISFGNTGSGGVTTPAFDYSKWDPSTMGKKIPGIKYFDFTNVPAEKINFAGETTTDVACKGMISETNPEQSETYQSGIIKFNSADNELDKTKAYTGLLGSDDTGKGLSKQAKNWPIIEPDPYSSICSFGFKTCGNIENGLISISADGWPLLFKALSFVNFSVGGAPTPFFGSFIKFGAEYCAAHAAELPENFVKLFDEQTGGNINDFLTYNKESPIYVNYSHTMAILGYVLKNSFLNFENDMTVLIDGEGKPYLPTTASVGMSIIDWLKYNMYFTM